MNTNSKKNKLSTFEDQWRTRFKEFADANEDDASIAGWSETGLQTRFDHFLKNWPGDKSGHLWIDVGCGAGTYSKHLVNNELLVLGFDYSLPTLVKAKKKNSTSIYWLSGNVKCFPIIDNYVDGILCFGVIQALDSSDDAIGELVRITKPNGQIWVDGLNKWCLPHLLEIASRKLKGKPVHTRYESPWKMMKFFKKNNVKNIKLLWLPVLPYKLHAYQWIFETPIIVKLLHAVPIIGALLSHSFVISVKK